MQANIDPRTHTILSWYYSRSFWIIFHGPGTRSGSIKGDQSLSILFQFWSLPKAAPWTEARVSRHLPHSQGTFLLVALPCDPHRETYTETPLPLQPYILQVQKTGIHMESGLSVTFTIRPGYTDGQLATCSRKWKLALSSVCLYTNCIDFRAYKYSSG